MFLRLVMKDYIFFLKEIVRGKSVLRSLLNVRLSQEVLEGKTIDIGAGKNVDYISFVEKKDDVEFLGFDIKTGASVDFECDRLPADDGYYDTVLFLNVMEHIYNYQHIAGEVLRILKPGGKVVGFVPFLMWYHPDHKDFFRYTHEALEKIFKEAGASSVEIEAISKGPFMAAMHMVLSSTPRVLRPPMCVVLNFLDTIFLKLRPAKKGRFALGYFFILK